MKNEHGPITRLYKRQGYGFVLTPAGWEVPFYRSAVKDCDIEDLHSGEDVSFQLVEGRFPKVNAVVPRAQLRMAS